MMKFTSEFAFGLNMDAGDKIDRAFDFEELAADLAGGRARLAASKLDQSAVGRLLTAPVGRMSNNLMTMWKLYEDRNLPLQAQELKLRYGATRQLWILSKLYNAIAGEEITKGSVIPGISTYNVEGVVEASKKPSRALEEAGEKKKVLGRKGPLTRF